jgi:hypothetical protein
LIHILELPLHQRAARMLWDFGRLSRIRAAAQAGTVRVLGWQGRKLCEASARIVTEAERLVARSKRPRNAGGSAEAEL